jgi:CheY-like chemotaxis protein
MGEQKNFKIMLADDDMDDRELFTEAASAHNVTVAVAANGQELMDALHKTQELPCCIFLDLNMPEKGGKECLEEIRSDARLSSLPIIIYSTSSSRKDIEDTHALGANLYVVKPSSFAKIRETIESVLHVDWNSYPPNADKNSFIFSDRTS